MGIRQANIKIRGEAGGGALGKVAGAISNIFGGGGAAGAPEMYPVQELPPTPPVQAGMFGIKGLPNWVIPVGAIGLIAAFLLPMMKRRRKK